MGDAEPGPFLASSGDSGGPGFLLCEAGVVTAPASELCHEAE